MRRIVLALAAASLSACTSATVAPPTAAPASQLSANPWYPGETVSTEVLIGTPTVIRRGTTPDGYSYTIFADGSGSVKSLTDWSIACGKDKMTDRRECTLTNHDAKLFIDFGASTSPRSVCVLTHDFPGRIGAIRAGSNRALDTDEDGCVGGSFINQLVGANEVTTRAVKWPYDYNVDVSKPTAGLKDALELVGYIQRTIVK